MKQIKYPKNEQVWVTYKDLLGEVRYIITSKTIRDCYYLYEISDGKLNKLGRAKTPNELINKYKIKELLC